MNSDNKFGECCKCPALMNDSRLFTNYLLNSKLNTYIKKVNGITDDNIYSLDFVPSPLVPRSTSKTKIFVWM